MPPTNKIIWVNFLHMYQPPWQERGVLEQVAIESYDYLLTLLAKYPKFRMSLNISGSLLEQLVSYRPDLIKRLQKLVHSGRIELVGTAYHHPILPLLSLADAKRQIALNEKILERLFPEAKVRGFYLPEMAYAPVLAKLLKRRGYEWLILDEVHLSRRPEANVLYILKKVGLKIVFRGRRISQAYPPQIIFRSLDNKITKTFITATDAEIYGHWHKDKAGYIEKLMFVPRLEICTVSQYLATLSQRAVIDLRRASWESRVTELRRGNFYSLWADPKNKIHALLWRLAHLASALVAKYARDPQLVWAREHLDRGLSSCTWWWASARRPSAFSPLTWNPDMVVRGASELVRSVRSLERARNGEKIQAEKLYLAVQAQIWPKHWRKYSQR